MIVLGVILILVGYLLPVPAIIATIGWYRNSKSSKKEAFQALPKEGADEGER